jgi:sugar phosphate isomerase/epimerase
MRLGVGLDIQLEEPELIARAYADAGYGAAICPQVRLDQRERIHAIRQAFQWHDVILAEIGVWNNMLDPDPLRRAANLKVNIERLALGDELGALCCVNIAGSFDPECWDGPHPKNLSDEAFELTVQNVRHILNEVKPKRTRYTIEPMPWAIPDSPDGYLELIHAVNHPMFGAHLDPVNMINCPRRYYENAAFLGECFSKLGPWIVSCHAKDILLSNSLTVHLVERRPGLGKLDYAAFLHLLNRLPGDIPLILEHLPQADYPQARDYLLKVAEENNLSFTKPGQGAS